MSDFKREIGGSIVPSIQDCERKAFVQMFKLDLIALGVDLHVPIKEGVALRVGKSIHAAVEVGLHEKLATAKSITVGREEFGDTVRTIAINNGVDPIIKMEDLALDILDEDFDSKVEVDTLPSEKCKCGCCGVSRHHFGTLVEKMIPSAKELVDSIEPAEVEPEIIATPEWLPGWQLKIHPDVKAVDGVVHDIKTGINYEVPNDYISQLGTYALGYEEVGEVITGLQVDYLKKPGSTQEAPLPVSRQYPIEAAKGQAEDQITRFVSAVEEFFDPSSGWHMNQRVFRANPSTNLCSKKFCPAYGKYCELTKGMK